MFFEGNAAISLDTHAHTHERAAPRGDSRFVYRPCVPSFPSTNKTSAWPAPKATTPRPHALAHHRGDQRAKAIQSTKSGEKKKARKKKKAKWMRRAQNTRQHLFGRLPTWPRQGGVEEGWESLRRGVIPLKTDRRTRGPKSKNSGARRGYSALEPFSEQPPTDEAIRTHSDDARGTFRHDTVVTALAA